MKPRALVVLNPAAGAGRAPSRFAALRRHVEARFRHRVIELDTGSAWKRALRRELEAGTGTRLVIAAGGDGTVHSVADAL
ncbi:MAG: diacylglycerol kinase family protein, partial [Longimicrobiales bacterium]|nr:diacylglycerol kinase family protein [Longimicrobiales bacterium]